MWKLGVTNMSYITTLKARKKGCSAATVLASVILATPLASAPAFAQSSSREASVEVIVPAGRAQIVDLGQAITDIIVSDPRAVDVQVKSQRQIIIYGRGVGESTVFATARNGAIVYAANVRVMENANATNKGQDLASLEPTLKTAMPDAEIKVTQMKGMALLTGTVAAPEDVAEAERLAKAIVGDSVQIVSRLKTATPLQVQLQVKFAEVNRDFMKKVGVNLMSADNGGSGILFGIGQGRAVGSISQIDNPLGFPTGSITTPTGAVVSVPINPATGLPGPLKGTEYKFTNPIGGTAINLAGRLLGLDLASAIDLAESDGLATVLAQPNLTAMSGETADFLAGGEIPYPAPAGLGATGIEFKQYGIQLSFTPTVHSSGRISLRVNPEVSQIASNVNIGGNNVPTLSTRRVSTTVEVGSGQSFIIGGLLSSDQSSAIDRTPGAGNLPILGALFRSNSFRRKETELVIVVTPYLVKPVSANEITLPTDGYRSPTDWDRIDMGRTVSPQSGGDRPKPNLGDPVTIPAAPGVLDPSSGAPSTKSSRKQKRAKVEEAAPGFGN